MSLLGYCIHFRVWLKRYFSWALRVETLLFSLHTTQSARPCQRWLGARATSTRNWDRDLSRSVELAFHVTEFCEFRVIVRDVVRAFSTLSNRTKFTTYGTCKRTWWSVIIIKNPRNWERDGSRRMATSVGSIPCSTRNWRGGLRKPGKRTSKQ
jgi:hypothetical protein